MAAVLVGLVGCAQGERDFIIGDESFTADEREAIAEGSYFITASTGHWVPTIVWGPLPEDGDGTMTIRRGALPANVLGTCQEDHFHIVLDPAQGPRWLAETTTHELGHSLGLEHISEPGTMNPNVQEHLVWSAADEASCVQLGVCAR